MERSKGRAGWDGLENEARRSTNIWGRSASRMPVSRLRNEIAGIRWPHWLLRRLLCFMTHHPCGRQPSAQTWGPPARLAGGARWLESSTPGRTLPCQSKPFASAQQPKDGSRSPRRTSAAAWRYGLREKRGPDCESPLRRPDSAAEQQRRRTASPKDALIWGANWWGVLSIRPIRHVWSPADRQAPATACTAAPFHQERSRRSWIARSSSSSSSSSMAAAADQRAP
jgi:hypothetical protein